MKKIILVVLVILSILITPVFAEDLQMNEEQKADLYNLGIMTGDENGDLRLNDTITRAEAIKMICVAGELKATSADEEMFPDVDESHWAYKYIYIAKTNGVIEGDEKGFFNPEDNVTNEEIIKMIVCLTGYHVAAETRGGYPAGYTSQASRIGITEGMQFEVNVPAIRKDVGIMISKALDIPMMIEGETDEEGGVSYIIADGLNGAPNITLRGNR